MADECTYAGRLESLTAAGALSTKAAAAAIGVRHADAEQLSLDPSHIFVPCGDMPARVWLVGAEIDLPGSVVLASEVGFAVIGNSVVIYGDLKVKSSVPNVGLTLPPELRPMFGVDRGVVLEVPGTPGSQIAVVNITVDDPPKVSIRRGDATTFPINSTIHLGQVQYIRAS